MKIEKKFELPWDADLKRGKTGRLLGDSSDITGLLHCERETNEDREIIRRFHSGFKKYAKQKSEESPEYVSIDYHICTLGNNNNMDYGVRGNSIDVVRSLIEDAAQKILDGCEAKND